MVQHFVPYFIFRAHTDTLELLNGVVAPLKKGFMGIMVQSVVSTTYSTVSSQEAETVWHRIFPFVVRLDLVHDNYNCLSAWTDVL